MKALPPKMIQAARCLLINQQGGNLAQMKISETLDSVCKTVGAVVMHAIAVLFSNSKLQLLLPFISMLENPAVLTVSWSDEYLDPAMLSPKKIIYPNPYLSYSLFVFTWDT